MDKCMNAETDKTTRIVIRRTELEGRCSCFQSYLGDFKLRRVHIQPS